MKRLLILIASLFIFSGTLSAQVQMTSGSGAPTIACTDAIVSYFDTDAAIKYNCQSGSWVPVSIRVVIRSGVTPGGATAGKDGDWYFDTSVTPNMVYQRVGGSYIAQGMLLTSSQAALINNAVPNTRTVNGQALSGNVVLSRSDVGLTNVPNVDATVAANITQTSTARFVTDAEKATWNGKESVLTFSAPLSRSMNAISITAASSGAAGTMSAADKAKLDALPTAVGLTKVSFGAATQSGSLLAGTTMEISVAFGAPMNSTSYTAVPVIESTTSILGNASVQGIKSGSQTVNGCVVVIRNNGLSTILSGSITVNVLAYQ